MTFAHPYVLLFLLLLPPLAWLKGRRGRNSAFLYSSVQLVRPIATLSRSSAGAILATLRWLGLAALIVAMSQPRIITGETRSTSSGIDIVVAIDLSGSMAAEDFHVDGKRVNRLVIAKDVLEKFIDKRSNDRIGLVAFAGRAYVAAPLTLDHDFLRQNVRRLELGMVEDMTAIGSAIMASLNRLRDLDSKSRIVILMTDGVNNAGKVPPLIAAEAAEALGIKVHTIGVGTHGTAPIPVRDMFGRMVYHQMEVDLDEPTLIEIARRTGGRYYRADSADTLRAIYEEINRLETTEVEIRKFQQFDELFGWFILGGMGMLLLHCVLGNTIWRKLP